jgi:hypothetical protein
MRRALYFSSLRLLKSSSIYSKVDTLNAQSFENVRLKNPHRRAPWMLSSFLRRKAASVRVTVSRNRPAISPSSAWESDIRKCRSGSVHTDLPQSRRILPRRASAEQDSASLFASTNVFWYSSTSSVCRRQVLELDLNHTSTFAGGGVNLGLLVRGE